MGNDSEHEMHLHPDHAVRENYLNEIIASLKESGMRKADGTTRYQLGYTSFAQNTPQGHNR